MGRFTRTLGPMVTIAGALAIWLVVMVTVKATASPSQNGTPAPKAAAAAPAAQQPGYVGEDTCLTCHEDMKKGYHGSPHSRTQDPRTPAANQGCESCHGPGQAHVEAGGDKTKIKQLTKISAREVNDTCMTCHNRSEHNEWSGGKHDALGAERRALFAEQRRRRAGFDGVAARAGHDARGLRLRDHACAPFFREI